VKLKQKINAETNKPIHACWVTECGYTVALCKTAPGKGMYQISAPRTRAPFAYTPNKNEVRTIIVTHKEQKSDFD